MATTRAVKSVRLCYYTHHLNTTASYPADPCNFNAAGPDALTGVPESRGTATVSLRAVVTHATYRTKKMSVKKRLPMCLSDELGHTSRPRRAGWCTLGGV